MSSRAIIYNSRLRIPASALHLEGFRRWAHSSKFPKRGKVSYISGEVHLDMSPEEIQSHLSAKGDIFGGLWSFCRQHPVGVVYADGALLINIEADLATEPDMTFCRWETIESGRVSLVEIKPGSGRQVEIHGSPDLVVEIISKSSVKKDRQNLREAYFRAKVGEYWLIDACKKEIEFNLLQRGDSDYISADMDENGFYRSMALDRSVRLTRELNRIGGWRYTLHLEP